MSAEQLREGDVVQLKSGGPAMTIVLVNSAKVKCKWFDGSTVHETYFPQSALIKVPESQDVKTFNEIIKSSEEIIKGGS